MKRTLVSLLLAAAGMPGFAAVTTLTDPAAVLAFQQGLQVEDFESITGKTPAVLSGAVSGASIGDASKIYDEVSGVRMSAGGTVGVQRPMLFRIDPDVVIDAVPADGPNTMLGATDSDGLSVFDSSSLIEMFFPQKVGRLGFQLADGLSDVIVYVLNTNFAFSQQEEVILETVRVSSGRFVAFDRDVADIGGLKILSAGPLGFAIDDLSFGDNGSSSVPEPATAALGLLALAAAARRRRAGAGR